MIVTWNYEHLMLKLGEQTCQHLLLTNFLSFIMLDLYFGNKTSSENLLIFKSNHTGIRQFELIPFRLSSCSSARLQLTLAYIVADSTVVRAQFHDKEHVCLHLADIKIKTMFRRCSALFTWPKALTHLWRHLVITRISLSLRKKCVQEPRAKKTAATSKVVDVVPTRCFVSTNEHVWPKQVIWRAVLA